MTLRVSEWILAVYFSYTSVLALLLELPSSIRTRTWIANGSAALVYLLILKWQQSAPREWHSPVRDWMPIPLILLAYKQMGWFAPPTHDFHLERSWIVLDRLVLRDWGLQRAIESTGWLIPGLLELSYLLVYAVPVFLVTLLYIYQRREQVDTLLSIYLLGLLLSYGQFPFWPSEPPRTVFPGEDFPHVVTFIRRWSLSVVGSYGIHTSVFPSAHVSGALGAAFAIRQTLADKPWWGHGLMIYAFLIFLATVYGRYHYVVDGLAGLAVGCIALLLGRFILAHSHTPMVGPAPSRQNLEAP